MRIAWRSHSVYQWTHHWSIARDLGVGEAGLIGLRNWRSHPGFGPEDLAVLTATDETLDNGRISAVTWADCAEQLDSPEAVLEMVFSIGLWSMFAGVLRSLEIPLEADRMPWPPDRAGSA